MTVATFPWQWPFVKTRPIKFWQRHVTARIRNLQIGQQTCRLGCNGPKPTLMDRKTTSIAFGNELQNFWPLPNRARMLIINNSQIFWMFQNEKPIGIGSTLAGFNTFINEKNLLRQPSVCLHCSTMEIPWAMPSFALVSGLDGAVEILPC